MERKCTLKPKELLPHFNICGVPFYLPGSREERKPGCEDLPRSQLCQEPLLWATADAAAQRERGQLAAGLLMSSFLQAGRWGVYTHHFPNTVCFGAPTSSLLKASAPRTRHPGMEGLLLCNADKWRGSCLCPAKHIRWNIIKEYAIILSSDVKQKQKKGNLKSYFCLTNVFIRLQVIQYVARCAHSLINVCV